MKAVLNASIVVFMAAQLNAEPAVMESVHSAHEETLGTDPATPFWQEAHAVYVDHDPHGKSEPEYRSEVRSRWTGQNLYLLFICPYKELQLKPDPKTAEETNQLWNWDVAEAFIGSDFANIRRYKEFEVSPQAEWVDLDINLDTPKPETGWLWNSGMTVSARIDHKAKVWYGAMRIPFRAIDGRAPQTGRELRINLFRCQRATPKRKFLTWQPTMSDSFHVPEHFGTLRLTER